MSPAARPQWQQATALITIGAGGIVTGLSFVPRTPGDLTSPASLPIKLLALEQGGSPAPGSDAMLRSAIVHTARHFLQLAQTRSPAEMEALIWRYASTDGADHGPSCAAFASLTLELGSHMAGLDSWVTGGTTYPWPVHPWVDGRVDPNPASPGVVSVLQDAATHGRWRPLGDGYTPQPGDWVLFDGHVEVVTKYAGGVLHTIGGDSVPNMSVNAHEYAGPFQHQGIAGFVDNGVGVSAASGHTTGRAVRGGHHHHDKHVRENSAAIPGAEPSWPATSAGGPASIRRASNPATTRPAGRAAATAPGPALKPQSNPVPRSGSSPAYRPQAHALPSGGVAAVAYGEHWAAAVPAPRSEQAAHPVTQPERPPHHAARNLAARTGRVPRAAERRPHRAGRDRAATADVPATGMRRAAKHGRPGEAAIPGLFKAPHHGQGGHPGVLAPYHRHDVPQPTGGTPGTTTQQAFISEVARGAMATQRQYGVPASVTIAQAIDESGWGQSVLATADHNLFGIKGTGPAGADEQPTQEFINGQLVNTTASFRVYHDVAQSIDAHARLLARSGDYAGAMSQRHNPDAFASALTGVYATDPQYGAKLIHLMRQYDLYRYDHAAAHALRRPAADSGAGGTIASGGTASPATVSGTAASFITPSGTASADHQQASAHQPSQRQPGRTPPISSTRPRQSSPSPAQSARPPHPAPASDPVPASHPVPTSDPVPASNPAPAGPVGRQPTPRPARGPVVDTLASPQAGTRAAAPRQTTRGPGLQPGGQAAGPHAAGAQEATHGTGGRAPIDAADPQAAMHSTAVQEATHSNGGQAPIDAVDPQAATHRSGPANQAHAASAEPAMHPATTPGAAAIPGVPHRTTGAHLADHRAQRTAPSGATANRSGGNNIPGLPISQDATAGIRAATPAGHATASRILASAGGSAIPAAPVPVPTPATRRPTVAPADSAPAGGSAIPAASAAVSPPAARVSPTTAPAGSAPAGHAPSAAKQAPAAGSVGTSGANAAQAAANRAPSAGRQAGPARGAATSAPNAAPAAHRVAGAAANRSTAGDPARSATHAARPAYHAHLPAAVREAFVTSARMPLTRGEQLYLDVAGHTGIRWEILAACDWMQCKARQGYSPVYGEKLGTLNPDGTCYRTRSAALEQCAYDLVHLARSVYQLDIATSREQSVRDLANVFAAFRWGGLLRQHNTSAMDFPYAVAGLTVDHTHMRWPNIDEPNAPDKPGSRFRQAFGAVPVVLGLNYQALM